MIYPIIFRQIESELYLFPWKVNTIEDDSSIILKSIYGLSIKYKNHLYILTTAHNINHNAKFICNDKILTLLFINKDLDVCILKNNMNLFYTENININLNFEKESIFINSSTFTDKIILIFDDIIESNITLLGPLTLLINCHEHEDSIKIEEGMSGIGLKDHNNNYIGLISRRDESNIQLVPLINFLHIIKNNDLCSFYELLVLENDNLKINKKSNKYYHTKKYKSDTFRKNDIILKVNKLEVINGYIYDKLLKIYISIYIYILLNKKEKDRVNFLIERNNIVMKIKIYVKSYNKLECIKDDHITLYYKNESIITYLFNLNLLINHLIHKSKIKVKIPTNFIENVNFNNKIYMKDIV